MPMETESPAKPEGGPCASVLEALGDGPVVAGRFRIPLVPSRAGRRRATGRLAGRSARAMAAREISSAANLSFGVSRDRRARRDGSRARRRRAGRATAQYGAGRTRRSTRTRSTSFRKPRPSRSKARRGPTTRRSRATDRRRSRPPSRRPGRAAERDAQHARIRRT